MNMETSTENVEPTSLQEGKCKRFSSATVSYVFSTLVSLILICISLVLTVLICLGK